VLKAKKFLILIFCLGLLLSHTLSVVAQDDDYRVHIRKDFGYGMGNTIQGRFSMRLLGDEAQVERVTFFVDDEVIASVDSAPFRAQFSTEDFEVGNHQLYAKVELSDKGVYITPAAQFRFISSGEAGKGITTLLIGLGGATILTLLIVAGVQVLLIKNKPKQSSSSAKPRDYGILGGTICPKCGRPFPRHIWGVNLMVGRLDRCEHCGKWVMTVRATPDVLRSAEEAEFAETWTENIPELGHEDNKDSLEDTKYFDEI